MNLKWTGAVLMATVGLAQTIPRPVVDVASIRPAAPNAQNQTIRFFPGGRLNATNVTVRNLVRYAYSVEVFQVLGGPAWIDSERYDIAAKPEVNSDDDAKERVLIQNLLAERFALTFHRETKELPVYSLVRMKNPQQALGLTKSSVGDCVPLDSSAPKPPSAQSCSTTHIGRDRMDAQAVLLESLIISLSRILGRTVVDETGLSGRFDIHLTWTHDTDLIGPFDPSIFTAVQEQLGLKLESTKGPVGLLVIDSAEKPSEN